MFCKHNWKVLSETTTESKIEHAGKIGARFNTKGGADWALERKHIQILTCEKCGKLERFVEEI